MYFAGKSGMLEHWIQPLTPSLFREDYLKGDRLGANLSRLPEAKIPSGVRSVALIGADTRWSKFVRRNIYRFAWRTPDITIHDLGDLRRTDADFVTGPLIELITSGVCPVIIGGHLGLLKAFRQAFSYLQEQFAPLVVHERLSESVQDSPEEIRLIGVQQHLLGRTVPASIQALHLSTVRSSFDDADTLIRESSCTIFDLSALSALDLPAQRSHSTSGFSTEEACMLMRAAGLHSGTRAVMLSGHDPMSLQLDQSANVVAQMLWYFLEAFNQCIHESPLKSPHCTAYTVHLDDYDADIKFIKSERTARWWVQCDPQDPASVFPCTYHDYHSAVNGQVTDRLISCTAASLQRVQ
jgi:hypothetical protein